MIIKNISIYTPQKKFVNGWIHIRGEKIQAVGNSNDGMNFEQENVLDGHGCYAIPGLIDLHFHGCMGYDFCDGTKEAIAAIAEYEASVGVTAIAPATMTLPVEELEQILKTAAEYKGEAAASGNSSGKVRADLVGINMEGPFISPVKKGAQDPGNIIPCDGRIGQRFLDASEGLVKFIGIAPEESKETMQFIEQMKGNVHLSLAHTNADYETAKEAFDSGADHAVHLYNAMPSFTHREPGVAGAVADCNDVTAELICDGIHIHPAMVRATFQMLGADRIILISDSMRATGMKDGRYTLGGLDVDVQGKRAVLCTDGALAGSVTNLMDCMRTAVNEMGISLEAAVACATMNPAKKLGIYERYGSLEAGKKANLLLMDQELNLVSVIKNGNLVKPISR